MEPITIYLGNKNFSTWSMRPWLALKHTGVPFEEVVIPLDRDDTHENIMRHSPSGQIPVLRHGERRIWDSLAICEYLAETFPAARLWPEDASDRALARSVSCEMHSGFAALRGHMPMNLRREPAPIATTAQVDADIARIFQIWETCRARRAGGGDFLFGSFGIADAMFAPVVTRFTSYGVPLDGVARAYAETLSALPAFREWRAAAHTETLSMPRYEGANAK